MRHFLVFIVCLLCMAGINAQTRKLAHRSHGGQPSSFAFLLEDDHAGAYNPPPESYHLEPWVGKIRKHYEKQAKLQTKEDAPSTKVEPVDSVSAGPSGPAGSTAPKAAPAEPAPKQHKSARKGAKPSAAATTIPEKEEAGTVIPVRLAKRLDTGAEDQQSAGMGLWWLAGGLLLIVGGCVYWGSEKLRLS